MCRPSLLLRFALAVASLAVLGAAAGDVAAAPVPPQVAAPAPPAPPDVPTPVAPTPPEIVAPDAPAPPEVTPPVAPTPPTIVVPVPPPVPLPPGGDSVGAFDTTATIDDPQWFVRMVQRGFRLYVMHSTVYGTCTPWPNAQAQMEAALAAGLKVAAYTRDPRCWQGGIEAFGPLASQLQFFALDVEADPGIPITHEMVAGIEALGVRPVVYSGYAMWLQVMGDDTSFADLPLWDTNAGAIDAASWQPDIDEPPPVPFGGWNTPDNPRVLVQQVFDVTYDGVVVDLDTVRASFLR